MYLKPIDHVKGDKYHLHNFISFSFSFFLKCSFMQKKSSHFSFLLFKDSNFLINCRCIKFEIYVSNLAGRYLAELTKQVFLDIENSKYQVCLNFIFIL